jgi:hypothetical protein
MTTDAFGAEVRRLVEQHDEEVREREAAASREADAAVTRQAEDWSTVQAIAGPILEEFVRGVESTGREASVKEAEYGGLIVSFVVPGAPSLTLKVRAGRVRLYGEPHPDRTTGDRDWIDVPIEDLDADRLRGALLGWLKVVLEASQRGP